MKPDSRIRPGTIRRCTSADPVLTALALLMLVGCPGGPQRIQVLPGYPVLGEAQALRSGRSGLVVLTATWMDLNLASPDDGTQIRHTGYSLYDERGEFLQYIRNYIGATDTEA